MQQEGAADNTFVTSGAVHDQPQPQPRPPRRPVPAHLERAFELAQHAAQSSFSGAAAREALGLAQPPPQQQRAVSRGSSLSAFSGATAGSHRRAAFGGGFGVSRPGTAPAAPTPPPSAFSAALMPVSRMSGYSSDSGPPPPQQPQPQPPSHLRYGSGGRGVVAALPYVVASSAAQGPSEAQMRAAVASDLSVRSVARGRPPPPPRARA
jgi:hypothetical protein